MDKLKSLVDASKKMQGRKVIFIRMKRICLLSLIVALFSLALMVADVEAYIRDTYNNIEKESLIIKSFITLTTLILVGLMIWFHYLRVQMLMIDLDTDQWYSVLSNTKIGLLILELLLYCIHTPPIHFLKTYEVKINSMNTLSLEYFLSFFMFFRLILVFRIMVLYNKLMNHAGSRCLGAFNKINFNGRFMIKSYMKMNPVSSLSFVIVLEILIASYIFRACERFNTNVDGSFANSIWVMMITFTTVGYGDIYPETTCGRTVSICTGIFGAGCTALVTAVLANALEFDHSENCFHNFVTKLQLDKEYKNAAAKILQSAWKVYKSKKLSHATETKTNMKQFLHTIKKMKNIRKEKNAAININSDDFDMQAGFSHLLKHVERIDQVQRNISEKMNSIENKIDKLCKSSIEKEQ